MKTITKNGIVIEQFYNKNISIHRPPVVAGVDCDKNLDNIEWVWAVDIMIEGADKRIKFWRWGEPFRIKENTSSVSKERFIDTITSEFPGDLDFFLFHKGIFDGEFELADLEE